MTEQTITKLWMPVTKSSSGKFVGILSDTSIDRDDEFMSKELIQDWAKNNQVLPALANHVNKMENLVGGWKNLRTVNKGGHTALMAEPFFFSKEANPLAAQIQKQVEEALENGLNVGISIGAIPTESLNKDVDGTQHRVWTKAELVEATWVPIQSNRNASFGHVAKAFDLNKDLEESTMTEEIKKEEVQVQEEVAPVAEEVVAEEVVVAEVAQEVIEAEGEVAEEVGAEKSVIADLKKEVAELKEKLVSLEVTKEVETVDVKKSIMKATVETSEPQVEEKVPTIQGMLKSIYG